MGGIYQSHFSLPSQIEGSYELVVRPFQRTLNRGDLLLVAIYVSGFGAFSGGKVAFYVPRGLLKPRSVPPQPSGELAEGWIHQGSLVSEIDQSGQPHRDVVIAVVQDETLEEPVPTHGDLSLTGNAIEVHRGFGFSKDTDPPTRAVPQVAGEVDLESGPPFLIRGFIAKKAPPGDHDVPFVLTYLTEGRVKSSRVTLDLHVRHWWERRLYQVITLAASVAAVAGFVLLALHI